MTTKSLQRRATWCCALSLTLLAGCASAPTSTSGWTPMFDRGSNLNDWTLAGDANWRIQDDAIVADLLRSKTPGYLVSKKIYDNTEIRAEVWVDSQTNSGIFIRCQDPNKIGADNCYEVNIWDTRPDPSYGTGAIVDVAKVSPMPKAGGQWNVLEITAQGDLLVVRLNGQETVRVRNAKLAKGHIALQYGSGIVKFRQVLIKPI
ncbi:MAG: DUF1080 domain-containing protein [Alphaproteobacteria bacterium]|nr:DUF1080 domain-containing protein [Alphaproteobacteria bacterium]